MIEPSTGLAAPVATGPQTPLTDLNLGDPFGPPEANELDREAFLKLLVAQLRYQDPLNPNDPSDFMATTAQFTTIEKLEELTEQGASNAIVTGLSMASSLVGRRIAYVGIDDVSRSGVVNSAAVVGGEVRLLTDDGPVSLTDVTAIGSSLDEPGPSIPAEATEPDHPNDLVTIGDPVAEQPTEEDEA